MTTVIPIHRRVRVKYAPDIEPPEIRARFGSILVVMEMVLALPAMFTAALASIVMTIGLVPVWLIVAQALVIFTVEMALFGIWPLYGLVLSFGLRDGARWGLLALTLSGLLPAVGLGVLALHSPEVVGADFLRFEGAMAWVWALPLVGLVALRVTGTGRPLPRLATLLGMFRSGWRDRIPAVKTEWGEVLSRRLHGDDVLRVPGGDFAVPPELRQVESGRGQPVRVTYDLRAGRIETIEVGPTP